MLFTPWSRYRIKSDSRDPPGLSGCLRGCGKGDGCCDGAFEAGGVGWPPTIVALFASTTVAILIKSLRVSSGIRGRVYAPWALWIVSTRQEEGEFGE